MTTDEIVKEIKSKRMTAEEIGKVFNALHRQINFIGGKIWTTDDIENAVETAMQSYDDIDESKKELVFSKAVEDFELNGNLEDTLNYDSDEEYECMLDAANDAIKIAVEEIYED